MNNSKLVMDSLSHKEIDKEPWLEQKLTEANRIVQAIKEVVGSRSWQVLKKEVFDGVVESLEKQIKVAGESQTIDQALLYRLQGQLIWARKYASLEKLAEVFKQEIENIKNQLK